MKKTDILIAGSGCAGLYCALHLPKDKQILIVTKSDAKSSDSYLAQGGMCVLKNDDDYESFTEDTLKAGHYENDRKSVEIMIRSSRDVLKDLLSYGADFEKDEKGELLYTKEGAHSVNRIVYHKDITGKEITETLYQQMLKCPNITIMENTAIVDILVENEKCIGGVVESKDGDVIQIQADCTVLATGGIGGLYKHSTNYKHLTGDAIALEMYRSFAEKLGCLIMNMMYAFVPSACIIGGGVAKAGDLL